MTDEIQGETGRKTQEGEVEVSGEREPYEHSTPGSLQSNFCPPERMTAEDAGEGYWVCQVAEGSLGLYGEGGGLLGEQFRAEEEEEAEELTLEEKISLDSKYLKSVLGEPLTFALLDIATKRPTDPIQYLGSYLLKWRWCGLRKAEHEENMKMLDAQRDAYRERIREIERQEMLTKEQEEEEKRRADREESSLATEEVQGEGEERAIEDG